MILLLPLLFTAASAVQLIEHFECGSDAIKIPFTETSSREAAELAIRNCNYAVKDDANLCCKEHDLCYEMHTVQGHDREYCDMLFGNCLQDVSDRTKNYACKGKLGFFYYLGASWAAQPAYDRAMPSDAAENAAKFAAFADQKPLGLDMQRLVDACRFTKGIAVHCHNTVYKCMQGRHERFKRLLDVVEHSYEDCRSTMHDCMQVIIHNEKDENCSSIARSIAKQANTYMQLDEAKHGRSIIETYPIVAARLIKQCNQSVYVEPCLLAFHRCAEYNRRERPEVYNAARKIEIKCHRELSACLKAATEEETSEDCIEARNLAVGRIRQKNLDPTFGDSVWSPGGTGTGDRRRRRF